MHKVELTQNDAVFILVATISPATLYLWIIAALALLNGLPNRMARMLPNKHEQVLLIALSVISFALWVVMVILIIGPSDWAKFSQPECNKTYGRSEQVTLLWSSVFLGQSLSAGAVMFGVAVYLRRQAQKKLFSPSGNQYVSTCLIISVILSLPFSIISANIISWTCMSLKIAFESLNLTPHQIAALLFLMQIPPPIIYFGSAMSVIMVQRLILEAISGLLSLIGIWMSPCQSRSAKQILVGIFLTLAMLGVSALGAIGYFPYSIRDFVDVGCWCVIWWKQVGECSSGQSRGKVALRRLS